MSNGKAIAAVTASLRALLSTKVKDPKSNPHVNTLSPEKANQEKGDWINLFLYHTQVEPSWRNTDMPRQNKPGETGHPPLPLNLYYLLTAFSEDKNEVHSHALLGLAMQVLHDHPLLDPAQIKEAILGEEDLKDSDLHEQIERVRITLQPLSVEELSKLWTAFQTQFRTSVSYQVSVVLIESQRPAKTPLPVLQRGKGDTGVASQPDVESPFPTLLGLKLPNQQPSALLDDVVTLEGQRLDAAGSLKVLVRNPLLPEPAPVTIQGSPTGEKIQFKLNNDSAKWVAGLYTVAVEIKNGDDVRTTNELPLTVAPVITSALPLVVPQTEIDGEKVAVVDLSFRPQFRPGQRAVVLIGDREAPADPLPKPPGPPDPTDHLTFKVWKPPLGERFLRLRIDGVDSLLVQRPEGQPPFFDPTQKVTIHD
ncbi:MAG TPA: DUF4255 domain-containing protein [Thermoanaerobaculia bacterium]